MRETHGSQEIEVIAGRNIVLSAGIGKTNADDLKWLMQTVLSKVGAWKTSGWAYIADCTKMEPVGPGEISCLVEKNNAKLETLKIYHSHMTGEIVELNRLSTVEQMLRDAGSDVSIPEKPADVIK